MAQDRSSFKGMSLYSSGGERKYLSSAEREWFFGALDVLMSPADRTYCEMIYWTGCRPSEALALTALQVDTDQALVIVRSAKKRGKLKDRHYRPLPVPEAFIDRLDQTHGIRTLQAQFTGGDAPRLWKMSRTTAWHRVRAVMDAAGIAGIRASAKGLLHGYGVHAAIQNVPETRIMKWLGHASLETTGIYLDVVGPEDRAMAERMWGATKP